MKKKLFIILFCAFALLTSSRDASAQNTRYIISGKVTAAAGNENIPGAAIRILNQ